MKKSILFLAIAAVFMPQPLLAQEAPADSTTPLVQDDDEMRVPDRGRKHGPRDGQHHGGKHRLTLVDLNADGVIGDDEAAVVAERIFGRLDRDNSGDLSEAEFTTLPRGRGWWRMFGAQDEAVVEVLKAKYASIDSNKDQKVVKTEFLVDARARFQAADADKDGKVTPWEFRSQN
jgi:hypothetical protein